jgi:hypothetical protein
MERTQISLSGLMAMIGEREVQLAIEREKNAALLARIAELEPKPAQTVPSRATLKGDIAPSPSLKD